MAGVTVRTLHHYDAIGLLRPTGRAGNGYRRYSDADLERLQRILFYRELDFDLDRIKHAMADPGADPLEHLRQQHALLSAHIERLQRLADAVAHAMEARAMDIKLTAEGAPRGLRTRPRRACRRGTRTLGRYRRLRRVAASCRELHEGGLGPNEGGERGRHAPDARCDGRRPAVHEPEAMDAAEARSPPGTTPPSTPAPSRCTGRSARCTSRTHASRPRTRRWLRAWRSTSTTRSRRTPDDRAGR